MVGFAQIGVVLELDSETKGETSGGTISGKRYGIPTEVSVQVLRIRESFGKRCNNIASPYNMFWPVSERRQKRIAICHIYSSLSFSILLYLSLSFSIFLYSAIVRRYLSRTQRVRPRVLQSDVPFVPQII